MKYEESSLKLSKNTNIIDSKLLFKPVWFFFPLWEQQQELGTCTSFQ